MKYSILVYFILLASISMAQSINGEVVDKNGGCIPNANIRSKGKSITTVSSVNGTYSIKLNRDSQRINNGDTLICSHIGYKTKYEVIQGNSTITFILEKHNQEDTISISTSSQSTHIIDELVYDKQEEKARKLLLERIKNGEEDTEEEYSRTYCSSFEIMAEFPGGDMAARKYIIRNTKIPDTLHSFFYPENHGHFRGILKAGFTIDKVGKVANVKIIKGLDRLLDVEITRVLTNMPPWKPAVQYNKNIESYKEFYIKFNIAMKSGK